MRMLIFVLALAGMVVSAVAGTKAGAERIVMGHRLAVLEWEKEVEAAPSLEAKAALLEKAPDGAMYGKRMIGEVGKNLHEEWAMPYAVWLLRVHSGLVLGDVKRFIEYAEKFHMGSEHLGEFSVNLVGAGEGDVRNAAGLTATKLKFLEGVLASDAGKVEKGEASLALSMLLGKMGGGADVNQRRLKLLRAAIIDAADSKVGETSVGALVQEEIYRLTKLSKGVVAPELEGVDAAGVPMKLSAYRGKAVILVFWSSWEQGAQVLEYLKGLERKYAGKPVAILGVNRDGAGNLKELRDLGKLAGRHFSDPNEQLFGAYRVVASPYAFVLDRKGRIEYSGQLGAFADLTVDAVLAEPGR